MRASFLVGAAVLSLTALEGVSAKPKVPALTSVADSYTTLDQQKAAKARKLAEYVIAQGSQRTEDSVQSVIRLGDKNYTINVHFPLIQNAFSRNNLSVWIRPAGTFDREYITTFSDERLDGRCDFGLFGEKVSENGEKIVYFGKFPDEKLFGWFGAAKEFWREYVDGSIRGLEHQERFQKLYYDTLERLINFYERRGRK